MAHFKLIERKRNRFNATINATYYVVDEQAIVCGSICVKLKDADSLRNLAMAQKPIHHSLSNSISSKIPVQALSAAFQNRLPLSKASLLRGCNGLKKYACPLLHLLRIQ